MRVVDLWNDLWTISPLFYLAAIARYCKPRCVRFNIAVPRNAGRRRATETASTMYFGTLHTLAISSKSGSTTYFGTSLKQPPKPKYFWYYVLCTQVLFTQHMNTRMYDVQQATRTFFEDYV